MSEKCLIMCFPQNQRQKMTSLAAIVSSIILSTVHKLFEEVISQH